MYVVHERCRPKNAHMSWLMLALLGWWFGKLVDISFEMCTWQDQFGWVNAHTKLVTHAYLGYFFLAFADVAWLICADHIQYCLVDAFRRQLMFPYRCAHDTVCACGHWLMHYAVGYCCFPDAHMRRKCKLVLDDTAFHLVMSLSRYLYSTSVLADLSWSHMPLAIVSC